jgi:hypothetical protein
MAVRTLSVTTHRTYSIGSIIGLAILVGFGYAMLLWRRNRESARQARRDEERPDYNALELRQGPERPEESAKHSNEAEPDPGDPKGR